MTRWNAIWDAREVPAADPGLSPLSRLLAADGMDSGFSGVTEDAWRAFTEELRAELGLTPGMSAFEVGCGAGAFLLDWEARGIGVGGIDRSRALVAAAQAAMPTGAFAVADAAELPEQPSFDALVSMGVFLYFPSLDYAAAVAHRMAGKARHAVALLDLPDLACRDECLREREAQAGGPEAYAARYRDLDHLFFDRTWVAELLHDCGLRGVVVEDQRLADYGSARFRFNAWGFAR